MSSTKIALVFSVLLGLYLLSLLTAGYTSPISSNRQDLRVSYGGAGLDVYFFYGSGCPHCARVEPFLTEMEQKYPINLDRYDIYGNRSLMALFNQYSDSCGLPMDERGVPTVFVGNTSMTGDQPILDRLEKTVQTALLQSSPQATTIKNQAPKDGGSMEGFDGLTLLTMTLAALAGSFSPCSIALIIFLIGTRILSVGSRKRALKVGLSFCFSVFIAYALFGFGFLSVVQDSGFVPAFGLLVSIVPFVIAALFIKDAFWPKKTGLTLEVPRSLKPFLMKVMKRVTSPLGGFAVGFVVAVFEVPCTGGPYLFVLGQLSSSFGALAASLLLYYNFIFVLPLVLICILGYSNVFSVGRMRSWSDGNKRFLRFAGGVLMMILGFLTSGFTGLVSLLISSLGMIRLIGLPILVLGFSCLLLSLRKGIGDRLKALSTRRTRLRVSTLILIMSAFISGYVLLSEIKPVHAGYLRFYAKCQDGCPRQNVSFRVYSMDGTLFYEECYPTDYSGYCQVGSWVPPYTQVHVNSTWPQGGGLWGASSPVTDGNGGFEITQKRWTNYPNGTESCGDSECDGFKYCFNDTSPAYVECRHNDTNTTPIWNQDCDTKKCCSCSAGTLTNPAANYNETHNSDCPSCEVCSDLDTCSYALNGTDPKKDCPGNDFCSGSGNCTAVPPVITVLFPQNQTYYSNSIPLTFTVDEPTSWIGYLLDSQANVTTSGNTTLTGLSDGSHTVVVYANETDGNTSSSGATYFAVDTGPPAITILSPQNQTYYNSSVPLNFTAYDYSPISWMGYSLDGEANVTVSGNTTLTLADGPHQVVVYANDTFGNMGVSNEVHFERAIIVSDDYPSIQAAINAAGTGDTVYVRNGTYRENVIVNKTLSLVGEDAENTIIDGAGAGSTLTIVADYVSVKGFTMRNGTDAGISLDGANYCSITENSITANNGRGVWLDSSSSNSVSRNNITNNGDGIYLSSSSNNSMSGNNITNNVYHGIWLAYSSLNNSISGNNITDNQYGIVLSSSSNNNSISGNNVTANNTLGIDLHSSSNNKILHNNFVNNNIQVYSSDSANAWDDGYPSGGNYWSDYSGTDFSHGPSQNVFGSDGIGDQPYVIDAQNQDNYPLMTVGGSLTMGSSAGGGKYSVC